MKQQMISFTEPQAQWLTEQAKALGISVSELVRRTTDWYISTYPLKVNVNADNQDAQV